MADAIDCGAASESSVGFWSLGVLVTRGRRRSIFILIFSKCRELDTQAPKSFILRH